MSEFRRRLFFAQAAEEPIVLPDGYTKYDWIQGDGTAYIDSGLRYWTEIGIVADMVMPADVVIGRDAPIVGAVFYPSSYMQLGGGIIFKRVFGNQYGAQTYSPGVTLPAGYVGAQITAVSQMKMGQQSLVIKQGGTIIVSGTATGTMNGTTSVSAIRVGQNQNVRLRRVKIYPDYDMETLAWDGIPCIDPNGVRGMYDLVSETFFSNAAASGTFSLGFDNHVPQGYREVEWVGANKDAQIAFSITSLATLKEEIRVKWTNFSGRQIMGLESGSGYWGYDGSKYEIAALSTGIAPTGGWDDLVITRTNNGIDCTINGTSISRLAKAYGAATNFNLFKVYGMGCACQIAEYKIGDGVTLYHDLVPCVRMSDNQPGFYDILQGKFHAGGTSVGAFVNS